MDLISKRSNRPIFKPELGYVCFVEQAGGMEERDASCLVGERNALCLV